MKRALSSRTRSILLGALLLVTILLSLLTIPPKRRDIVIVKESLLKPASQISTLKFKPALMKEFTFDDQNSLKEWEEKIFKNKVLYSVEKEGSLSYVKAQSENASSALYLKIDLNARRDRPFISWRWRVLTFPEKKLPESVEIKDEADFAARVYIIFPAKFFTNSKAIEYVWTEKLPVGTIGASPYLKNIKVMVLESGKSAEGEWKSEERDISEDYNTLFGRPPEYNVGAIAFLTNSDHTASQASALYDDIRLGYIKND